MKFVLDLFREQNRSTDYCLIAEAYIARKPIYRLDRLLAEFESALDEWTERMEKPMPSPKANWSVEGF